MKAMHDMHDMHDMMAAAKTPEERQALIISELGELTLTSFLDRIWIRPSFRLCNRNDFIKSVPHSICYPDPMT